MFPKSRKGAAISRSFWMMQNQLWKNRFKCKNGGGSERNQPLLSTDLSVHNHSNHKMTFIKVRVHSNRKSTLLTMTMARMLAAWSPELARQNVPREIKNHLGIAPDLLNRTSIGKSWITLNVTLTSGFLYNVFLFS